jgi:hypothetical protein
VPNRPKIAALLAMLLLVSILVLISVAAAASIPLMIITRSGKP